MNEIVQICIYVITVTITFMIFYALDFHKILRVGKVGYAILVYVIISLAIGFLVGKLFIEIGELFRTLINNGV